MFCLSDALVLTKQLSAMCCVMLDDGQVVIGGLAALARSLPKALWAFRSQTARLRAWMATPSSCPDSTATHQSTEICSSGWASPQVSEVTQSMWSQLSAGE